MAIHIDKALIKRQVSNARKRPAVPRDLVMDKVHVTDVPHVRDGEAFLISGKVLDRVMALLVENERTEHRSVIAYH